LDLAPLIPVVAIIAWAAIKIVKITASRPQADPEVAGRKEERPQVR
jgi:hypothetical protein